MELKIKCVTTTTGSDGAQYGKFVIEPLERGFGTTIGNSLRRVLLSSLEGSAVTSIRIEGITHEYTSIPGVVEDVIDIMLNLKGLVVKTHGSAKSKEVKNSIIQCVSFKEQNINDKIQQNICSNDKTE